MDYYESLVRTKTFYILRLLSCSHLLSELGEPVCDEEGRVHEPIHAVGNLGLYCTVLYCTVLYYTVPVHAVGDAGLLAAGQRAAEAAGDADVPAGVVEVVHLRHQLRALLLHLDLLLEVAARGATAAGEVEAAGRGGEGALAHGLAVPSRVRSVGKEWGNVTHIFL